ncbi:dihydroneopterin aldolase [Sodalinema gerasimenkoae]|uniref:dihydroneopterin aldolase n=1 Tax=Sodalinema gerasimenkoae TaxID=2862348 RepID=UPI001357C04C|nr:dihydroneopterin aldolase [Sodalinema gerasimenkoae]
MDSIELSQIRCYGYTGFLPEEQVLGQWFEVDLTLWLNLQDASQSDVIDDTLDYRQAIAQVKEIIKQEKFALVERLAGAIADSMLNLDKVQQVRVRLSKPAAPIPDFGGRITIDITRPLPQDA